LEEARHIGAQISEERKMSSGMFLTAMIALLDCAIIYLLFSVGFLKQRIEKLESSSSAGQ
jgi:hypothetical protein